MERIEQQYPVVEREVDVFDEARFHHEAFMRSRCESGQRLSEKDEKEPEMVIGREDELRKVLTLDEIDSFFLLHTVATLELMTFEADSLSMSPCS